MGNHENGLGPLVRYNRKIWRLNSFISSRVFQWFSFHGLGRTYRVSQKVWDSNNGGNVA